MKICSKCKVEKPLTDFQLLFPSKNDGKLRPDCKQCKKSSNKKYNDSHKERMGARLKLSFPKALQNARNFVADYLKDHPCVDCGNFDVRVLEFDHVKDTKLKNISKLISQGSRLWRLEAEIKKCEVRCANCHRIKTIERGNWYIKIPAPKL